MSARGSWGGLIAGVLPSVVGCGARPVPEPTPPVVRPVAAAVTASAPVAVATSARVGTLVPLLSTSSEGTMEDMGVSRITLRYGRGVLQHVAVTGRTMVLPRCPLKDGGERCALLSISTTGKSPPDDGWMASARAPEEAKVGAPRSAPWDQFSPGKDVVYAYESRSKELHRLDDQGKDTLLVSDDTLEEISTLHVLEAGGRLLMLSGNEEGKVALTAIEGSGERARLGERVEPTMGPIPAWRQNAQGIRMIEDAHKMAMIGAPVAISLRDEKDSWAMVWIEGVAPPFKWPAGKVHRGKRKGKHECGGPPSRPLTDVSVEKRIHVTRFQGLKQVRDAVVRSTNELDPAVPLAVASTSLGVEVNGVTYDARGKKVASRPLEREPRAKDDAKLSPDEELLAFGYDQASQEGMVMVRAGEARWGRSFNAAGEYTSEPRRLKAGVTPDGMLWRVGGRWYGLHQQELVSIEDGAVREVPSGSGAWVLGGTKGPVRVVTRKERQMTLATVPAGGGEIRVQSLPTTEDVSMNSLTLWERPGGSLALVVPRQREDQWLGRFEVAGEEPGKGWETLWSLPEESKAERSAFEAHQVQGDLVLVVKHLEGTLLRWARAGQTVEVAEQVTMGDGENSFERPQMGPVVKLSEEKKLWGLLPSTPGPVLPLEGTDEAMQSCAGSVATGPRSAVLVCAEGVGTTGPGVRVGLRRVSAGE